MPLYPGPMRHGIHNALQGGLLRIAFILQDVGSFLNDVGRCFEDWVAPSGRQAVPQVEPYWRQP